MAWCNNYLHNIYILLGIISNPYIIQENVQYAAILYKGCEYCEFLVSEGGLGTNPHILYQEATLLEVICSPQYFF